MPRIPRHLHRKDLSPLSDHNQDQVKAHEHLQFRRREASDDESDGESSVSKSIDGAVFSNALHFEDTLPTRTSRKKHVNKDGDEWRNCQQKKDIIAAFLDEGSGIQSMTPAEIFETYADGVGFEKRNAVENIRRLKNKYIKKEGVFSEKEASKATKPEAFKTRTTQSRACTLLLKLHTKSEQSGINNMSVEEIHQSDPSFRQYPLSDFKKYNRNVKKLAQKRKEKLNRDTDTFRRQMESKPRGELTDRGLPFWDTHPGYEMLKGDFDKIQKGEMSRLTPMQLYQSRNVYKEFPFEVFKNHFNQEQRKRRESNFWRHKMKLNARKAHMAEVDEMYDEWLWNDIGGDELVKTFSRSVRISVEEENEEAAAPRASED